MQITEQFVQQVSPPPPKANGKGSQAFYRDSSLTGFGLRVASGGTKSFIVEKRIQGKVRRITLGRYDKLTVEQARIEAAKLLERINQQNRPQIKNGQLTRPDITLQEAYADYLKVHQQLKKTTLQDYQRSIDGPLQDWLSRPLLKISAELILSLHTMYGSQSRARINNAMRLLRAIFNYAQRHYIDEAQQPLIKHNPVEILTKEHAWYNIKARQSYLSAEDLPRWWQATFKLKSETARDFLHFLLFTGLTRTSVSQLTFADINFEHRLLCIRKKKGEETRFFLPMNDFIDDMLRRRAWACPGTRGYIFPGAQSDKPLTEPRTAVKRVADVGGIPFTLYDLRRTYLHAAEQVYLGHPAEQPIMLKAGPEHAMNSSDDVEVLRQEQQKVAEHLLRQACP